MYTMTIPQAPSGHMVRPPTCPIGHKVNSLLVQLPLDPHETWLLPQTKTLCVPRYQGTNKEKEWCKMDTKSMDRDFHSAEIEVLPVNYRPTTGPPVLPPNYRSSFCDRLVQGRCNAGRTANSAKTGTTGAGTGTTGPGTGTTALPACR